jgi:subtilisin family serine protease
LLSELLQIGLVHGTAIVAAYDPSQPNGGFPASFPGVFAVSDDPLIAQKPGVYLAPGRGVITTQPGGRWGLVNGSSYSAAHVTGLLALLRSARSQGNNRLQLIAARSNGGAIDACASLLRVTGPCDCACTNALGLAAKARR